MLHYQPRFRSCLLTSSVVLGIACSLAVMQGQTNLQLQYQGSWPGNAGSQAAGVLVTNNRAYLAINGGGLAILDVSDPVRPRVLGSQDITNMGPTDVSRSVALAGSYAYVADHLAGLHIIDLGDPTHPQWLGTYNTSGYAYDVTVSGRYAFVADGNRGLHVIDVSDPRAPNRITGYTASVSGGYAEGVQVVGDTLYLSNGELGLFILNLKNPDQPPRLTQPKWTPGSGFQFNLSGYPAQTYAVHWSTNLQQWTVLTNVIANTTAVTVKDADSSKSPRRAYRAVKTN